jgi:PhnB protein
MEPVTTPKLAPYLIARDASGLARFIEKGIGGKSGFQVLDKDGKIGHLEMRVSDSVVMLAEAPQGRDPFPAMLHLYVTDADAAYQRALKAGATSVREPTDADDGRRGGVRDAWGNEWWFTRPAE